MNEKVKKLFCDLRKASVQDDDLELALGVGASSIRSARNSDSLPARWYQPIYKICEGVGVDCPMDVFAWAKPAEQREAS